MTSTDGRILNTIAFVVFGIVAFGLGMLLEHRLILHRIERAGVDKAQVDGHTLNACSLGCRTEDDVACSRFVDLVRSRR